MIVRILLILLALFIMSNLIIMITSIVFGVNLYKTHGRIILKSYGIFVLFIAAVFIVLSAIGLM